MSSDRVSNFEFLRPYGQLFVQLPSLAERYLHEDPNTALLKLRQFAELLAKDACARLGVDTTRMNQFQTTRELVRLDAIDRRLLDVFDGVRKSGNEANHEFAGSKGEALHQLRHAFQLGLWFHRTFSGQSFTQAFVAPEPPGDSVAEARRQNEQLLQELETVRESVLVAKERAALEVAERQAAEARALAAENDAEAALALATETEEKLVALESDRHAAGVGEVVMRAVSKPETLAMLVDSAKQAAKAYDPDESETRHLIDQQLRAMGWEVDSEQLRHGVGVRPAKGRDMAIAEWPTASGPADYVLFRGLVPLAVVEAKKRNKSASGAIDQAKRYSRDFRPKDDIRLADDAPWGDYRVPFVFSTNGRPFLRQLKDESGVWILDVRRPTHHPRPRDGWPTPADLEAMARQNLDAADARLEAESADYLPLRDYQHDAVRACEEAIRAGKRKLLVAMATGTGKTRTAICLTYRLIKAGRFRRVLFLVDRSALGEQALNGFSELRLEQQQSFTSIYDVKALGDIHPDADTKLQIATVQGMVRRVLYGESGEGAAAADAPAYSVDSFDLIVVDECHRGYNLDREMSDTELEFRDQADYISKYRRVLDHFDAVKIGLTATPALHTTEIFGDPISTYSYRRAVIEDYLADHEPPIRIVTNLAADGIHWQAGEDVERWDPRRGQQDLFQTPDEIHADVEAFNKKVLTENFNLTVARHLAMEIDPSLPGKTLVFCVNDRHADQFVRLLKQAFAEAFGQIEDDAVQKITGAVDRPLEKIKRFRNERLPSVAVTVDLLTTGVDVPAIVNLVFLRRVKSRILYDQMRGRATRKCPGLYGDRDKEVFRIFDAVQLYDTLKDHTDMKPVVQNPNFTYRQLVDELLGLKDDALRGQVKDELMVKLRRAAGRIEKGWPDDFEAAAGLSPRQLVAQLASCTPVEAASYFEGREVLVELLDLKRPREDHYQLISHHADQVRSVTRGYGEAEAPEDYLESFGDFLAAKTEEIAVLHIVTTRPRDLTRKQLRELKLLLDREGFNEASLRTAHRESTNQDIAASILGFIRQQALGSPLVPYEERVQRALRRLQGERRFTGPQRQWLTRIGKQLMQETIVDREALDSGQFSAHGGHRTLNRIFGGEIDQILAELHEHIWKETA